MVDWKPSAPLENLQRRAQMLAKIRQFFAQRGVLEVETPNLASTTVPDVYIESVPAELRAKGVVRNRYLQTSPEFFMKRLLASGSGSIYQIAKAFRQEEEGRIHNSEFTLLEWYRVSFNLEDLINELEQLVQELLSCGAIERFTYRDIFATHLSIDPHSATEEELRQLAQAKLDLQGTELSKTDCLQLLLAHCIEPRLPDFCFIYDYPKEQAALSVLAEDETGMIVAKRFELFGQGIELANGYQELSDAVEQRRRFEADNKTRSVKGLVEHEIDERLMAALESGLPECAGVAVGLDRVLMLATAASSIDEVLSFDSERA